MLQEEELSETALLVFANKQDMAQMKVPEISDQLGLHQLRTRDWFIQGCCALTGEGLYDGLDWMTKAIAKKKS